MIETRTDTNRIRSLIDKACRLELDSKSELFEKEAELFIRHKHGDDWEPWMIKDLYVQYYQKDDMALCLEKVALINNQFPFMKWTRELVPYILFKDWNDVNLPTVVTRYWQIGQDAKD